MFYPDDETGNALQTMYDAGMDMSTTHDFEFFHLFRKKEHAERMCRELKTRGNNEQYSVEKNARAKGWDVCVSVNIVPTHQNILDTESLYGGIARKHGGVADGWELVECV